MLRYQLAHDPDILGRIEAAEALGEKNDDESLNALSSALNNDPFWGVRVSVARALGTMRSEKAQAVLIQALEQLDATQFSRVRAAITSALGQYQAPQQAQLAQRSAQALQALLEQGDVSYRVESAAATALGRTRTAGSVDLLTQLIERPSWMNVLQRGIFNGMAETGEDRVVDTIATYLNSPTSYPTLRRAAAAGLGTVGRNKHLYSEEARQRAVTALCNAIEHDTWEPVRAGCAWALMELGEKRAIGVLEHTASRELESLPQRQMRMAAHVLRSGGKDEEQLKSLRKDLDEVREENRKLREQLSALEARLK
jgi:aminopeptidase N